MKKIFLGILSLILIIGVILTPQNTNCVNASDLFDNFSSKAFLQYILTYFPYNLLIIL